MTGIVIFDKDNTLVEPLSGSQFVQHPRDQKILAGADKAVQSLHERGYQLAMAYNQETIEAGHKTIEDALAECRYALELFPEIELGMFCPSYQGFTCCMVWRDKAAEIRPEDDFEESFRKPDPGMLVLIHRYFGKPRLSDCWMVGDALEDEQASEAFGCNFMASDIFRDRYLPRFSELQVNGTT
ncbi:HAD-IIIA family hydrolase [Laspinema palackyanum]|uniref:HAD-IIIA family hydrolase n=1 Tax=Laspinema palackyanum TaxID=3231601 RepID=UPI00345CDB64|nr:HAD-IIIA family hydrolase [Laspinema sp. D2c]